MSGKEAKSFLNNPVNRKQRRGIIEDVDEEP